MPDRAILKAAVLKALPVNTAITWDSAQRLTDAIVDAVTAVHDQDVTVEWGLRHRSGNVWYSTTDEREARSLLADGGNRGNWKLVQRRLTEWEAVSPDA